MGRPFEDRAKLPMQRGGDLAAPGAGRERDMVDQGANGLGRLVALLRAAERLGEALHLSAIDAGDVRIKVRKNLPALATAAPSSSRSRVMSGRV